MIKLLKTTSTSFDKLKHLIVKAWNGKSDTRTARDASPYGIDSNPVKDMVALYIKSEVNGAEAIVGYFNKNRLAAIGETRIFATNAAGTVQTYHWLKNNGTQEFGGNTHNLIRYAPLNTALAGEVNAINAELVKIATAINAIIPGAYVVAPITLDISASKINELKTI